jgi:hypothetical protein
MNIETGGHSEQTSRWNKMEIDSKSDTQTENRDERRDCTTQKHLIGGTCCSTTRERMTGFDGIFRNTDWTKP